MGKERERETGVQSVARSSPLSLWGGAAIGASAESSRARAAHAASCKMRHGRAFAGIRERISLYVFILFHTLPKAEEASELSEPQVCARARPVCYAAAGQLSMNSSAD